MKLLLIGMDGTTFDVIMPWIREGKLPNLAKLIKGGCYGELQSVFPPVTAPAWTSFYTGKNPGKHGIFDFNNLKKGGYGLFFASNKVIKDKKIWEYLSENNVSSGWVNLPLTYPVDEIKGFMISGMLSGSKDSEDVVWPRDLKSELGTLWKDYILELEEPGEKNRDELYNELIKMIKRRTELILYLIKNKNVDFLAIEYQATDLIQHFFWDCYDKTHLLYKKELAIRYSEAIFNIYKLIDEQIGRILKEAYVDNVFCMSDHGFGKMDFIFNLNDWLLKEGFLKLKGSVSSKSIVNRYSILKLLEKFGLRKLGYIIPRPIRKRIPYKRDLLGIEDLIHSGRVDWKNTKAFNMPGSPFIFINLKGKRKYGSVTEDEYEPLIKDINTKLNGTKHPVENRNLQVKVLKCEDIYNGRNLNNAPDLLLIIENFKMWTKSSIGHDNIFTQDVEEGRTAKHRMNGIFIACGKDVKKGNLNARIIDLTPTILHIFNIPLSRDMDGNVLKDIFKKNSSIGKRNIGYDFKLEEEEKLDKAISRLKI